ncbi:MAG: protein kinase [Oligoflexia bacterium]|nr:protein kinase [Oligoflexia bacterium]
MDVDTTHQSGPPAGVKAGLSGHFKEGDLIDARYAVLSLLGKGGMGEVYRVHDQRENCVVALKLLSPGAVKESELRRFNREILLTQKLDTPFIVKYFDQGTADGQPYFTMEYIEGQTLRELVGEEDAGRPLPFNRTLLHLIQIASGLKHTHSVRVVHRDIKPENIMITKDGAVKITDFGISRSFDQTYAVTGTGEIVGTIFYMAPEQIRKNEAGAPSDIYAFGVLAYELTTGRRPFYAANNLAAIVAKQLTEPMPSITEVNPEIPAWFDRIVQRCCEKEVRDRYASMDEVLQDLLPHLHEQHVEKWTLRSVLGRIFPRRDTRVPNSALDSIPEPYPGSGGSKLSRELKRTCRQVVRSGAIVRYSAALIVGLSHLFLLCEIPGLSYSGVFGRYVEPYVMDVWFALRGEKPAPDAVVVIGINEESYTQLGESHLKAWPRTRMAELLEKLAPHDPKGIVLDFRFTGATDPEVDQRLASAIALSKTYIGKLYRIASDRDEYGERQNQLIPMSAEPLFVRAAYGEFNINRPSDGNILRRFRSRFDEIDRIPPVAKVIYEQEAEKYVLPGPTDYLNYYGPPGAVTNLPFYKALQSSRADLDAAIRGKYVFVGQHLQLQYSQQQTDTFLTPYHIDTPGVEIHATAAANLLDNSWIRHLTRKAEVFYSLFIAGGLAYLLALCSPLVGLVVLGVSVLGWAVGSYLMFLECQFLPGITLCVLLIVAYAVLTVRYYFKLAQLKRTFGIHNTGELLGTNRL